MKTGLRTTLLGLSLAAPAAGQIDPTEFVDATLVIPTEVTRYVAAMLPERSADGASFLSSVYSPNLHLTEEATVTLTYFFEAAGYNNSFGYFTYTEDPLLILDRQLIFPRVDSGVLSPGDSVTLRDAAGDVRTFPADTHIGFFLVADGWDESPSIAGWDAATATLPSLVPGINEVDPPGKGTFTSLEAINPEAGRGAMDAARHVAMLSVEGVPGFLGGDDFVLMGFEDLNRLGNSDDDFNDAVFFASATPASALDPANLAQGLAGDPDGDGIVGTDDHYPDDVDRALITSYPAFGRTVAGLEDLYPDLGDGDFNDAVVAYNFRVVTDAAGLVKDVEATFHLLARGSAFTHRLGLHVPGLPEDATGTVRFERFLTDDAATHEIDPETTVQDFIAGSRRSEAFFPFTHLALPGNGNSLFVNTEDGTIQRLASSARLVMTFDEPLDPAVLGSPPYDVYWLVFNGVQTYDVHFAGHAAFPELHVNLPVEEGPEAFLDDEGFPWMIQVPYDWRFPLETKRIQKAYPDFLDFAASHGASRPDWFNNLKNGSQVGLAANEYLVNRAWTVALPAP